MRGPPGYHPLVRVPWHALSVDGTLIARGQGQRRAIRWSPGPWSGRLEAIQIPSGSASDRVRPFARSCHLLPPGCTRRGDASTGEERRAHQRLSAHGTAL
jgi:hypothetical protein